MTLAIIVIVVIVFGLWLSSSSLEKERAERRNEELEDKVEQLAQQRSPPVLD